MYYMGSGAPKMDLGICEDKETNERMNEIEETEE